MEWRVKKFYDKRVLIDVIDVFNSPFADSLVCLTGAEMGMLRNLCQYLHRRTTFVSEYRAGDYLAPTNEEWDAIQAIVAELEEKLMGCEELIAVLNTIAAQLACLCNKEALGRTTDPIVPVIVQPYIDDGTLIPDDPYGPQTPASENRCAVAQLTFWTADAIQKQLIQPFQLRSLEVLLPVVVGLLITLAATVLTAIPVGVITSVVATLLYLDAVDELQNLNNAMAGEKQDLICALYDGLGTSYTAASQKAREVINNVGAFSAIDKAVMNLLFSPWAIAYAQLTWTNQSDWAIAHVQAGACADCEEPVIGSDWYAVRVWEPDGDCILDHSVTGNYWVECAVCGPMPAATVVGMVFEPVSGSGLYCRTNPTAAGCSGQLITTDGGYDLQTGQPYYWYKVFTHNENEAIATLEPTAIKSNEIVQRTGPGTWKAGFRLGWSGVGTRMVRVRWIVYAGQPA